MKIFKILLILALGLQVGLLGAEGETSSSGNDDHKYYLKYQSKAIVNDGECHKCDEVKDGFVAVEYDYDNITGTTYCNVYLNTDLTTPIGFAHKQVKSCAFINRDELKSAEKEVSQIIQNSKNNTTIISSIGQNKNNVVSNEITFSKFMVGLVTLDPNIISRQNIAGEIVLNKKLKSNTYTSLTNDSDFISSKILTGKNSALDGINPDSLTDRMKLFLIGKNGIALNTESVNSLDVFNKNNMGYFNDLFASNEKVYQHLQVLIFILVGGFFVMTIGASKIQAYLENRGESEGKQPYLHKFYIPLLMVGVFFMPIPEGNGYHSTVMQNMIRYFAQYSTTIADMANTVGAKTYMDKIYSTAGHLSYEIIKKLGKERELAKKETEFYKKVVESDNKDMGSQCQRIRADQNTTYIGSYGGTIKIDNNGEVFYSCLDYAKDVMRFNESSAKLNRLDQNLKFVSLYGSKYSATLNKIDEYFTARNKELGWFDVMLTPTAGILVEIYTLSEITEEAKKFQKEKIQERQIAIKQYFSNGDLEKAKQSVENQAGFKMSLDDGVVGYIGGRAVYMMLPGGMALKDFIYQAFDFITNAIKSILSAGAFAFGGVVTSALVTFGSSVIGSALNFLSGGALEMTKVAFSYYIATVLMEWTISMIPLLAVSTACLVACISYLVSLCKYFYISPFVTAWAMATKRTDKIIDFLLQVSQYF